VIERERPYPTFRPTFQTGQHWISLDYESNIKYTLDTISDSAAALMF
jgi:hypothetical protein